MRDWERQRDLLHRHDSAKFLRLTPRTEYESPVFEVHGEPGIDLLIVLACAVTLCVIVIGLTWGWL